MVLTIFNMIATSGFLTSLECTEFVFGRHPGPHWGSLQRSPDPVAGLRGRTSKEKGGREKRKGEKKGRGREREGRPPFRKFFIPPLSSGGTSSRLSTGALPLYPTGDCTKTLSARKISKFVTTF